MSYDLYIHIDHLLHLIKIDANLPDLHLRDIKENTMIKNLLVLIVNLLHPHTEIIIGIGIIIVPENVVEVEIVNVVEVVNVSEKKSDYNMLE